MWEGSKSRQLDSSRLESSRLVRVKVDSSYWKSSRERLSVNHSTVIGGGGGVSKSRQLDSSRLESSRLVSLRVDSTYCESSRERLSVKHSKAIRGEGGSKSRQLDSGRHDSSG